ncbi:unnamed protein product [Mucor hiemalis]
MLDQRNLGKLLFRRSRISTESSLPERMSILSISPVEIEKNVMKPICDQIVHYLESILKGAVGDSVEALALTGGFHFSDYLVELIKDMCCKSGTKVLLSSGRHIYPPPIQHCNDIIRGAIHKAMDTFIPRADTFKLLLDRKELSMDSIDDRTPKVFVFIDYGCEKTRVSYIYPQPGQLPTYANINHIVGWPGQSALERNLPTMDIILIAGNELNGSKKTISLKGSKDCIDRLLQKAQIEGRHYEYYTFFKDKHSVIMFTHSIENSKNFTDIDEDDLRLSENGSSHTLTDRKIPFSAQLTGSASIHHDPLNVTSNNASKFNDNFNFTVTQKRISFQEFSIMYFEYLTSYLYDYFDHKISTEISHQFQFCVTQDSLQEPVGFKLTDENWYTIANKCGTLSTDAHRCHDIWIFLERAQATTMFCREVIKGFDRNQLATHLYILQVQLTDNRCTLLLNRFPFFQEGVNVIGASKGEEWSGIYKYEEPKSIRFNAMDIICNNLWIHVQKYQHTVLQRCGRHQISNRRFNVNKMRVFNNLLFKYMSMANLELTNSEKVNEICICENGQEGNCCRVRITNIDLLQICIIPVIDRLASEIRTYVSYVHLRQKLRISNVFVMGVFLFCRYQRDYNFLEDLLLMKLGKINALYIDDFGLHSMIEATQTTIVNAHSHEEQNGHNNTLNRNEGNEQNQESLALISLNGSVMHGINSRNQLFERVASRTYATFIELTSKMIPSKSRTSGYQRADDIFDDKSAIYSTCKSSNIPIKVNSNTLIPIILKGSYLTSASPNGEDIDTSFTIESFKEDFIVIVAICALDQNVTGTWNKKELVSESEMLIQFKIKHKLPTYPFVVKMRPSQTHSYKFWVEYGQNESTEIISVQETVLLKANFGKH